MVTGQIKVKIGSDNHIVISMDTFTSHKVIKINEKKVFMNLIYKGTDSGNVKSDSCRM